MSRKRSVLKHRGMSLVIGVISMLSLVAMIGLSLDVGFTWLVRHQLQNAADAAALAAVQQVQVNISDARQAAINLALANAAAKEAVDLDANTSNAAGGDIVVGRFDRDTVTFTPQLNSPNAVKVVTRRIAGRPDGQVSLFFGPLFGVGDVDISATATAMIGGGTGAGIIALCGTCRCALDINGTPMIDVDNAPVQVNSNHNCAVCASGSSATLEAPVVNVVGGSCINGSPSMPPINSGAPTRPDPLAYLPMPSTVGAHNLGTISGSGNVNIPSGHAVYYAPGGITRTGGNLTLPSNAIYILDGAGFRISGNTNFTALNVMLFITGTGIVNINGTGNVTVTPQESGTWENISIFQARSPTGNCGDSRILGTASLNLEGTLYFPCADLELGGTGDGFGNQLIAYTLWLHGTGDMGIEYIGREVAPGRKTFLVE